MAEIEVQPLSERLSEEEIEEMQAALHAVGVPRFATGSDAAEMTIAENIDDDVLDDFLDRLEALDAACDIYLPIEFDSRVTVGDLQVGSTAHLLEALDELKDELEIDGGDEDEDDEEEDEDDTAAILAVKLKALWKLFYAGATEATERLLPLHVVA